MKARGLQFSWVKAFNSWETGNELVCSAGFVLFHMELTSTAAGAAGHFLSLMLNLELKWISQSE